LTAIQRSDQKLWPFRTFTQAWRDQTSSSPSIDSSSTPCKRACGNSSYSLTAIQRSDQSSGHFEPLLKPGATRPHHLRVSIPHQLHAKGHPENSIKSLNVIQRSDQNLWPFRTVTQAWRDQTSSSPSIDSSSTPSSPSFDSSSTQCQRTSGNSSYSLTAIQRSDKKLWPFQTATKA